jgi:hypothetical protein
MTAATFTSREVGRAATLRADVSSVAHVADGYARSLRPFIACVSRADEATCSGDGL